MSEERFVDLESRLAHMDQMLQELNDVVTEQQARIMQLEDLCRTLLERVRSLDEGGVTGDPLDERPPHY